MHVRRRLSVHKCVLCREREAEKTSPACGPCAETIARFVLDGPPEDVERIWIRARDVALMRSRLASGAAATPRVHADLALAYRDMGLMGDALVEAAAAVVSDRSIDATEVLVSELVGGPDLANRLRALL